MIRSLAKPRHEIDADYSRFVKTKRCCLDIHQFPHACRLGPTREDGSIVGIEPHHVSPRNGTKGMGSKVSDRRQVPVCHYGHRYCEQHPLEILEFLNARILELNREYAALHPEAKPVRASSKPAGLKSITVRCAACDLVHEIPAAKITRFGAGLRYRCIHTNELMSVSVA